MLPDAITWHTPTGLVSLPRDAEVCRTQLGGHCHYMPVAYIAAGVQWFLWFPCSCAMTIADVHW